MPSKRMTGGKSGINAGALQPQGCAPKLKSKSPALFLANVPPSAIVCAIQTTTMKRTFLCALAFFFVTCLSVPGAEMRDFTNQQGMKIKARLVSFVNSQVTIMREDGRQFTLPLAA